MKRSQLILILFTILRFTTSFAQTTKITQLLQVTLQQENKARKMIQVEIDSLGNEIGSKSIAGIEVAKDGYIKAFDLGRTGEIIPSEVGGSTTTYMCDYHWCNSGSTALRTLLVGGRADYGAYSGLGSFYSNNGVSYAFAFVGFRTIIRLN